MPRPWIRLRDRATYRRQSKGTSEMLLLIPGPVTTRPEVRAAMAQDIAPWDNDTRASFARIKARVLGIAGGHEPEHAALVLQGCGHFATEAAVRSFVPRD